MPPLFTSLTQTWTWRVRAHNARLHAQQLQWQARQTRQQVRLMSLGRRMPDANPLTLAVTLEILRQYGLLDGLPSPRPPQP